MFIIFVILLLFYLNIIFDFVIYTMQFNIFKKIYQVKKIVFIIYMHFLKNNHIIHKIFHSVLINSVGFET